MLRASQKVMFVAVALAAFTLAGCASHATKATPPQPTAVESTSNSGGSGISTNASNGTALSQAQALKAQAIADHSIYFDFDKSNIKPQYRTVIDTWAKYLLADPTVRVQIQGNTDERGTRAYNQALGQRRAVSVVDALEAQGVPFGQLSAVSFGEERPVCTEHDEACWHLNRRVDIVHQ